MRSVKSDAALRAGARTPEPGRTTPTPATANSRSRRSMGDRLDSMRGRLSTDGGARDGAVTPTDARARAASPLPNFTLFDLPSSMIDGAVEGDESIWTGNEEDNNRSRIFRRSIDRRSIDQRRRQPNAQPQAPPVASRHASLSGNKTSSIVQRASTAIQQENRQSMRKPPPSVTDAGTPITATAGTVTPATELEDDDGDEDGADLSKHARWALIKTDLVVIPFMALVVMLQYLDKAIFSYAALLGLQTDLAIGQGQYSFAASIYYIGMISGLPIWTFALQLISPDIVMGVTVALWGAVTMCHAATHSYSAILAVRFFLGFLESCVTPALVLITGTFYTQRQTISRTAIWYAFNGVALILGGGLSYGLLVNPSVIRSSLAIWRQLYLILGGITVFLGLLLIAFMPNHPATTRLFSPIERKATLWRLGRGSGVVSKPQQQLPIKSTVYRIDEEKPEQASEDHATAQAAPQQQPVPYTSRSSGGIPWKQWWEAIRDPRLYLFFAGLLVGSIPNGGVTAYSTQLLAGFGFSIQETLLVSIAPGGGQVVSVLLFILVAVLTKSRILGANVLLFIAIAGSVMMYVTSTGRTAKTVGYVLLNFGSPAVVALYSFIGSAVLGHGKRVLFTIVAQLAYALGNIIGPLVFLESETMLNYPTAKRVIIGTLAGAAATLFAVGAIHAAWNYRRNALAADVEESGAATTPEGETDFERKSFRYVY